MNINLIFDFKCLEINANENGLFKNKKLINLLMKNEIPFIIKSYPIINSEINQINSNESLIKKVLLEKENEELSNTAFTDSSSNFYNAKLQQSEYQ